MTQRTGIQLRDGRPGDQAPFFDLLVASTPEYHDLLGADARDIMTGIYQKRGHLFSFEHTRFAECGGSTAGMLLGYDWRTKQEQTLTTGILMLGQMRVRHLALVPLFLTGASKVGQVHEGEFFISNIAAYPLYHGDGVGAALLHDAAARALARGARALVLEVKESNKRAVRFYEKHGFEIDSEFTVSLKDPEYLFRMIKTIA